MSRQDAKHQTLGGKLGPRLAELVNKGMEDHLRATALHRVRLHAEGLNEFFRGMTREKRQHISPLTGLYLGHDTTPPEVEKLLRFITHGQGEASEILNMLGVGSAVGTSITAGLANYLAPINQRMIASEPYGLLDPATIASAIVRRIDYGEDPYDEANRGGISTERLGGLVKLAEQFPGVAELLEMLRRGLIDAGEMQHALYRNGITGEFIPKLIELRREHLSPADAALASLRTIISEEEGAEIAAVSGIDAHDFSIMVKNTGEPPGLMQLLEAYRRGFIDDTRLRKGISQSRVRNEWADVVEKLRFTPASAADAIAGLVQGHLPEDEAKQIAQWNGLRPEDFSWLHATYGNPASNLQMLQLWNRGVVTEQQVEEAIREGRTKNKYIPAIKELRVRLPEARQVIKMIGTGAVTQQRGAELLHHEGYQPDVVEALIHSATSGQVVKEKELAVTQVAELYHDKAITEDVALQYLAVLGYHPSNAKLTLAIMDLKRERTLQEGAIKAIRPAYVNGHISKEEASIELDKLKVPPEQREYYLELWAIERASIKKRLTEAQVVKANEAGLIPDSDAEKRLEALGYNHEDARILLDLQKHRTTPAP